MGKVRHRLGCIYDLPFKKLLWPILKTLRISLDPSPARWGFFAVFLAWGFFCLSLFYTMPPLPDGGNMMWLLWLGVALILTAFYVGGYFLRHQDRDPSSNQLSRMDKGISDTNSKLDILIDEIRGLRKDLGGRTDDKPEQ